MAIITFEDYPNTETPVNAENLNEIITTILKIFGADVDTFSEASTYALDDFVIYQNTLWKCTTAVTVAGAWTGATNWEETSILVNE